MDLCKKSIEGALKLGATDAEAFALKSSTIYVKLFQGDVESLTSAESYGIGLRAFMGGKMGYVYGSDPSEKTIDWMAEKAVSNAKLSFDDEINGLPETGASEGASLGILDASFSDFETENKIDVAKEMESAALNYDKRIRSVEESVYVDSLLNVELANSKGFRGVFERSDCYGFVYALAGEGAETETGISYTVAKSPRDLKPSAAGIEAAKRAVIMLGSKTVSSAKVPVIFDPFAGIQLLQTFSRAVLADSIQKGRSPFMGKIGTQIASGIVNIMDDGSLFGGLASAPFDGEGVQTSRTDVVKDGILNSYLFDTYTARKSKTVTTGNARRPSYMSTPEVGPTNFWLQPGKTNPESMIGGVSNGFYVMEISGLHSGANPITGQFSVGASGLWIKDGALSHGVRGITIAGQLEEILKRIVMVGDDLRWVPIGGSFGAPTFMVEEMTVGGE